MAVFTTPFTFHIDIYADTVCIWSYIGSELLDRAIQAYKSSLSPEDRDKVSFALTWRPYVLYPNAGVSVRSKRDAIQKIYRANAPEIFLRVESLTKENSIDLVWDGTTGNSINSHKLILLAIEQEEILSRDRQASSQHHHQQARPRHTRDDDDDDDDGYSLDHTTTPNNTNRTSSNPSHGTNLNNSAPKPSQQTTTPSPGWHPPKCKQTLVTATLLRESWSLGADISSPQNLARIAVTTGLFPSEALALTYLDSSKNPAPAKAVLASTALGKKLGVTAVPSYLVNDRWQVGGMQDVGTWLELFGRIQRAATSTAGAAGTREAFLVEPSSGAAGLGIC